MYYETERIREHIAQLQSKPVSQLTDKEKQELSEHEKIEKERQARRVEREKEEKKRKAEEERKAHEYYLANKTDIDRENRRRKIDSTCRDVAEKSLKFPRTYQEERMDSVDLDQKGKLMRYTALQFSGTNAFGVRINSKIECVGNLDDPDGDTTFFLNR
ncbi:hypothetical protein TCT1_14640 [Xenorhabdus sp. TCT-1]|uniref:Uncharacterized protein n=2 Tax=Xenorhabdus taiwanensis TaxID=3085177 RepID=A0ABM8JV23_9GAMM|nr:hypothetical protein TCT1_14640 [Xenorhabdus sp. TCT-1]